MVRVPAGPATSMWAPSAISTGGRSMCGSAWARWPPTVATLRTRTLESVRRVAIEHRQGRHGADPERPVGLRLDGAELPDGAQADQPGGTEHAGLHHQHQGGATGDRAHGRIIGIEQPDGLRERGGLLQLERDHGAASAPLRSKAACSRAANWRSISLALE